jgi:hypothetical protein
MSRFCRPDNKAAEWQKLDAPSLTPDTTIEDKMSIPTKSKAELEAISKQNQVNSPFLRLPSEI